MNFLLKSTLISKIFPFPSPTALMISYPRSGSSWIGDVINTSPGIAFLREPISQSFSSTYNVVSIFEVSNNNDYKSSYERITHKAFNGMLPKNFKDVKNINDFSLDSRKKKKLFIKEVNYMGIDLYKQYNPQLIILLRNPAAIADSYRRMNWIGDDYDYEDFAYNYGNQMNAIIEKTRQLDTKVVLYEDIALHPFIQFIRLFMFLNVNVPNNFSKIIKKYCNNYDIFTNPYETKRVSFQQVNKWKKNLSFERILQLKKGLLRSNLQYYRCDKYWDLIDHRSHQKYTL